MEINGKPIVSLPKKTTYLCKVKFTPDEQKQYSELEIESKLLFETYMDSGVVIFFFFFSFLLFLFSHFKSNRIVIMLTC